MNIHQQPYKGQSSEWEIPPEILAALSPFDDDPARPGEIDGLRRSWHGFVWLNPPYGPEIGLWLARLAHHRDGLALTFARTETKWFTENIWCRADAVLFLQGRPHFYRNGERAKGNSGGPLIIAAYGTRAVNRLAQSALAGVLVSHWTLPVASSANLAVKRLRQEVLPLDSVATMPPSQQALEEIRL